ncbi:hypothetical protein A3768_1431 [Ralstonia solanacearum]|nr:hypothetical protein A3768_1431 [Ralstonia solanacearum]
MQAAVVRLTLAPSPRHHPQIQFVTYIFVRSCESILYPI